MLNFEMITKKKVKYSNIFHFRLSTKKPVVQRVFILMNC